MVSCENWFSAISIYKKYFSNPCQLGNALATPSLRNCKLSYGGQTQFLFWNCWVIWGYSHHLPNLRGGGEEFPWQWWDWRPEAGKYNSILSSCHIQQQESSTTKKHDQTEAMLVQVYMQCIGINRPSIKVIHAIWQKFVYLWMCQKPSRYLLVTHRTSIRGCQVFVDDWETRQLLTGKLKFNGMDVNNTSILREIGAVPNFKPPCEIGIKFDPAFELSWLSIRKMLSKKVQVEGTCTDTFSKGSADVVLDSC